MHEVTTRSRIEEIWVFRNGHPRPYYEYRMADGRHYKSDDYATIAHDFYMDMELFGVREVIKKARQDALEYQRRYAQEKDQGPEKSAGTSQAKKLGGRWNNVDW